MATAHGSMGSRSGDESTWQYTDYWWIGLLLCQHLNECAKSILITCIQWHMENIRLQIYIDHMHSMTHRKHLSTNPTLFSFLRIMFRIQEKMSLSSLFLLQNKVCKKVVVAAEFSRMAHFISILIKLQIRDQLQYLFDQRLLRSIHTI